LRRRLARTARKLARSTPRSTDFIRSRLAAGIDSVDPADAKSTYLEILNQSLAALAQGRHPRDISFSACQQAVTAAWGQWPRFAAAERVRQGADLLVVLGRARVGNRPDRCEPRAVKRRPKEYDRLMKPRGQARAELLAPQDR